MRSETYDRLKWVALVLLPALSALYVGVAEVWTLPYVSQVVGTLTLLDTFLGLVLGKSSKNYQERTDTPVFMGDMVVVQEEDGSPATVLMEPAAKVPIFPVGKLVTFRVKREQLG
jgi:hypothetical protein